MQNYRKILLTAVLIAIAIAVYFEIQDQKVRSDSTGNKTVDGVITIIEELDKNSPR